MSKREEKNFFNFLVKAIYTQEFMEGKNLCVITNKDKIVTEVIKQKEKT